MQRTRRPARVRGRGPQTGSHTASQAHPCWLGPACPPNTYSVAEAATCVPCLPGSFSNGGAVACTCSANFFSVSGSSSAAACTACPAGSASAPGSTACTCLTGYSSADGLATTAPCTCTCARCLVCLGVCADGLYTCVWHCRGQCAPSTHTVSLMRRAARPASRVWPALPPTGLWATRARVPVSVCRAAVSDLKRRGWLMRVGMNVVGPVCPRGSYRASDMPLCQCTLPPPVWCAWGAARGRGD
jgi:hypothetical protein